MIYPIFSTSFSIGRALWSLEDPAKTKPESADSILSIVKDNNLKSIILLEDSFVCFKKALEALNKLDCQLIFGIRFNICNNNQELDPKIRDESAHKISIFAKNDSGCKQLMKLYSFAQTKCGGFLDYGLLKERFTDDLLVVGQFYDSFIHKNALYGKKCLPDFSFCQPVFWLSDHGLPFDHILRQKTLDFATKNGYPIEETHHIYYKNQSDVEVMMTLKILTNRKMGKAQTLDRPELEQFSSDEFCWTKYAELHNPNILPRRMEKL